MRREWPGLGGGDQNGKGIGAHECNRIPLVAQTKMLWDIHSPILLLSCPSRRLLLRRDRNFLDVGDQNSLSSLYLLPPSFTSTFHFRGKGGLKFRQILSLSRMCSIRLVSREIRVHRCFRAFRSRWMYPSFAALFSLQIQAYRLSDGPWFGIE